MRTDPNRTQQNDQSVRTNPNRSEPGESATLGKCAPPFPTDKTTFTFDCKSPRSTTWQKIHETTKKPTFPLPPYRYPPDSALERTWYIGTVNINTLFQRHGRETEKNLPSTSLFSLVGIIPERHRKRGPEIKKEKKRQKRIIKKNKNWANKYRNNLRKEKKNKKGTRHTKKQGTDQKKKEKGKKTGPLAEPEPKIEQKPGHTKPKPDNILI